MPTRKRTLKSDFMRNLPPCKADCVGLLDKVTRAALSITPQTGKVIVLSSAKPRVLIAEPTFGGLLLPPELKREQGNNLEIIFFLPEGKFVSLFPN
jgi:hypothetical protein